MRILRGRSNLEVSSQGFAIFVVGLVIATFLGGAVRTVLSSDQVHSRIVSELKSRFPKHEFQIGRTEVLLSRGIWPALGLRVHDLTFKQDVCGKLSFVLTIPQAILPLDILSLRKGVIRLNEVEISGGGLHLDYHDCAPHPAAPTSVALSDTHGATPTPPMAKSIPTPRLDWPQAAKILDGIELKNFAVTYEKNPTWKLLLNSAFVNLGRELNAQALVDVQKSLPFGALVHPVEFDLRADKNVMQWNFNAEFKEGHVHVDGSVDVNSQSATSRVSMRQVPIQDFMSEMFQMGFVDHDLQLKATWLSCSLKWEGLLQNYAATPIQMRDCRVEGSYGRTELAQADFWLNSAEYFKVPARFKVTQLQMQPVLEALNRQILPAVMPHLGVWSGDVEFSSPTSWQLDGHLQNAEIVFVNESLHGKQVVESLHTQVQSGSNSVHAKIDDIKIRDGEFSGFADFDLDRDWRNGTIRAEIDRLIFSPAIQQLLVGGTLGPLTAHGQGNLLAGELSQWKGDFALPVAHGEGWSTEDLRVNSHFKSGVFTVEATLKSARVDSAWRIYPQLRAVHPAVAESWEWSNLNARAEIQKSGGVIPSIRGEEIHDHQPWNFKGDWVRGGELSGLLAIGHGKKSQTLSLRGEKGNLLIQDAQGAVH